MGTVRGECLYFSVIFILLGGRTDFNMVVSIRIMSKGVHGCWVSKGVICKPVVLLAEVHPYCLATLSLSAEASQLRLQKEEDYKDKKRRRRKRMGTGEEEEGEKEEEKEERRTRRTRGMRTRTRRKRRGGGLVEKEEEEAFIFLLIFLLPASIILTLGCGHFSAAIG